MNRDRNKLGEPAIVVDTWLNVREAAMYMRCTRSYVANLCRKKRIPYAVLGIRRVMKRQDLDAHVESLKKPVLAA